ncbi:MAG: hypothetical protein KAJ18_03485 [Candidatus Omnitrophica bacterium]|nr:hypothetical protein [Candidatus Omnitrophota bacterium]
MKINSLMYPLVFFLLIAVPVEAREHPLVSEEVVIDMTKTYSYCESQNYSLAQIQELFPVYKNQVIEAQIKFNAKFGQAVKNLDKQLSDLGESWQTLKKDSMDKIKSMSDFSNLTDTEVKQFINEVNQRAEGKIQSPFIETLLMYHPSYIRNPALEFKNGYTLEFDSDGHKKNKGIHFTVDYPKSWKAEEAERPNIVKKFGSENGRGLDGFLVLIKKFPISESEKITKADIAGLFNKSTVMEMLPKGVLLSNYSRATIDSFPGAMGEYEQVQSRLNSKIFSKNLIFMIFVKDSLVIFNFTVGDLLDEKSDVIVRFELVKPLFNLMANSIVIQDRWKETYQELNDVESSSLFSGNLSDSEVMLSILLSIMLTWGWGLSIPLLLRFVILKRPLKKPLALFIVSILWFANLCLFIYLESQSKSHVALFLVAYVSYVILRKGSNVKKDKESR